MIIFGHYYDKYHLLLTLGLFVVLVLLGGLGVVGFVNDITWLETTSVTFLVIALIPALVLFFSIEKLPVPPLVFFFLKQLNNAALELTPTQKREFREAIEAVCLALFTFKQICHYRKNEDIAQKDSFSIRFSNSILSRHCMYSEQTKPSFNKVIELFKIICKVYGIVTDDHSKGFYICNSEEDQNPNKGRSEVYFDENTKEAWFESDKQHDYKYASFDNKGTNWDYVMCHTAYFKTPREFETFLKSATPIPSDFARRYVELESKPALENLVNQNCITTKDFPMPIIEVINKYCQ